MIDPLVLVLLVIGFAVLCLGIGLVITGFRTGGDTQVWHVQFEAGERVYVYERTEEQMRALLRERYQVRRRWPHRVRVLRGGELRNVDLRLL
jgi:uncharacterized radical SAM superfamily Fe-S cluster-containing enzyme